MTKVNYSPKQVARAIGVSESSVKRWCDQGVLPTVKTAGGHRRLHLTEILEFCRLSHRELVNPELLGLPANCAKSDRTLLRVRDQLRDCLLSGDGEVCREIVFDQWTHGVDLATISDQLICPVFTAIGEKWACHEAEVYQERRACEVILRALHEIRTHLDNGDSQWQAVGGTPSGDQYVLPTTVAELVLAEAGWQARSLGSSLPFETLASAVRQQRPRLFWLSVSYIADPDVFVQGYSRLHEAAHETETAIAVGGFALRDESLRQNLRYSAYCDNMQHLVDFARTLRKAANGRVE